MAKQQSNSKVQVMSEFDVRIQQTSEKLQQIREKEFEIKLERFTMMLNKDAEPSKIMSRRKELRTK